MEGIIETIDRRTTKQGKPFWVVTLDDGTGGERYSVWEEDIVKGCSEGDTVRFEWKESGDFKKITSMNAVAKAPPGRRFDKNAEIRRMNCLTSSVNLISGFNWPNVKDKRDEALVGAKIFERYVQFGSEEPPPDEEAEKPEPVEDSPPTNPEEFEKVLKTIPWRSKIELDRYWGEINPSLLKLSEKERIPIIAAYNEALEKF